MSDALLKNTFNKISPAYELVADVTISSATTQVDFSGLNFGKDDDLLLVSQLVASQTGGVNIYVNWNDTTSQYYNQFLNASGSGVGGARLNQAWLFSENSGRILLGETNIKLTNSGSFVWQSHTARGIGGSAVEWLDYFGSSNFTLTSITNIKLYHDITNGIGVGSRFQLYRLKAKKVCDVVVGVATTQMDLTGFTIDKDSEYMLISDITNAVGSGVYFNLYTNGNYTTTNYYSQNIGAGSTTVGANRDNFPLFTATSANSKSLSIMKLKLTNSGYFVSQINTNRDLGGSSISLLNCGVTSTFTATSITSLRIASSVANAIGIGSRFTLYKLR